VGQEKQGREGNVKGNGEQGGRAEELKENLAPRSFLKVGAYVRN